MAHDHRWRWRGCRRHRPDPAPGHRRAPAPGQYFLASPAILLRADAGAGVLVRGPSTTLASCHRACGRLDARRAVVAAVDAGHVVRTPGDQQPAGRTPGSAATSRSLAVRVDRRRLLWLAGGRLRRWRDGMAGARPARSESPFRRRNDDGCPGGPPPSTGEHAWSASTARAGTDARDALQRSRHLPCRDVGAISGADGPARRRRHHRSGLLPPGLEVGPTSRRLCSRRVIARGPGDVSIVDQGRLLRVQRRQ